MTQDQISLYDSYRDYIDRATTADSEAAALLAQYQAKLNESQSYKDQAKVIAAQLGITVC